jgi:hypothetical protein
MDKFEQHIKRMKGLRDVYEAGTGQHNILSMLIADCEIALRQPPVSGCDSVKTTWDIRECFKHLRLHKNHHLGLGDIRLTIEQQDEICDLVERFYH